MTFHVQQICPLFHPVIANNLERFLFDKLFQKLSFTEVWHWSMRTGLRMMIIFASILNKFLCRYIWSWKKLHLILNIKRLLVVIWPLVFKIISIFRRKVAWFGNTIREGQKSKALSTKKMHKYYFWTKKNLL